MGKARKDKDGNILNLITLDGVESTNLEAVSYTHLAELAKIERGEASADGFTHSIEGYTREITAELLG